jgi:hypothetical protein
MELNSICEGMQKRVGNILHIRLYSNSPWNFSQPRDIVVQALTTAMYVMRVRMATPLCSMPEALTFCWDIFLSHPLIADWEIIDHDCKQYVNGIQHTQ